MAASGMAKMVDCGVERKSSGEMWRKVAMKWNPFDRSNWEALDVRFVNDDEFLGWWWWERRVAVIMTARSMEAEVKNTPLPICVF